MSTDATFPKKDLNTFPYGPSVSPESLGLNESRLARVLDRFKKQQSFGLFPGGQLVVRCMGKLAVNEVVGIARGFRTQEARLPRPVQPQTAFPVLSAGKPLAAICIALLEERGRLDIEAPIVQTFPEFGEHGKDKITTLDVLTHRSGILMPDFVSKQSLWGDRVAVQTALIETVPTYPRGTLAYHPYEYGWILNEIVLRVDGRSLPDFFVEELADPLELPALRFGLAGRNPESVAFTYWLGTEKVNVAGINVAENFETQNSVSVLAARNPATSLVCDAASIAAFWLGSTPPRAVNTCARTWAVIVSQTTAMPIRSQPRRRVHLSTVSRSTLRRCCTRSTTASTLAPAETPTTSRKIRMRISKSSPCSIRVQDYYF